MGNKHPKSEQTTYSLAGNYKNHWESGGRGLKRHGDQVWKNMTEGTDDLPRFFNGEWPDNSSHIGRARRRICQQMYDKPEVSF